MNPGIPVTGQKTGAQYTMDPRDTGRVFIDPATGKEISEDEFNALEGGYTFARGDQNAAANQASTNGRGFTSLGGKQMAAPSDVNRSAAGLGGLAAQIAAQRTPTARPTAPTPAPTPMATPSPTPVSSLSDMLMQMRMNSNGMPGQPPPPPRQPQMAGGANDPTMALLLHLLGNGGNA